MDDKTLAAIRGQARIAVEASREAAQGQVRTLAEFISRPIPGTAPGVLYAANLNRDALIAELIK